VTARLASVEPAALEPGGWLSGGEATLLLLVLALATVGTLALFAIGLVAYRRRGSGVYLLLTVALGLLVGRSIMGFGTALDLVPMPVHHLLGHGADFAIAALVLYAIVRTGAVSEDN
jgi:predicted RND superfamily exporter protein